MQLIEMYPSLNPFIIRQQKACEVFLLVKRIKCRNKGYREGQPKDKPTRKLVTDETATGGWY
jgi:hypothetical protein